MSQKEQTQPYSFFPAIQQQPDRIALTLAEGLKAAFIDQGFINTMRFSELNGDEEYDNTFLYIAWHGYLETGLQQLRAYNEWLLQELEIIAGIEEKKIDELIAKINPSIVAENILNTELYSLSHEDPKIAHPENFEQYLYDLLEKPQVKKLIPYDQRMRIYRYIKDYFAAWKIIVDMATKGERDGKKAISIVRQYLGDYNENIGVDFTLFYDGHTAILNGRMARGRGHKKEIMQVAHGSGVDVDGGGEDKKKHWWSRG